YTLMAHIHACSGGVPARINKLCARALAWAASEGAPLVTTSALDHATEELGWHYRRSLAADVAINPTAPPAAPVPRAQLVITMQGLPDREITLEGDRILVGRGEEADVSID